MIIFVELFVLPALVVIFGGYFAVANPLNLGVTTRIIGSLLIFAIAYVIAPFTSKSQSTTKAASPENVTSMVAPVRSWLQRSFQIIPVIILSGVIVAIVGISTSKILNVFHPFQPISLLNPHPLVSLIANPPLSVRRNQDGTERIFVHATPSEILSEVAGHTDQQVQAIVARYLQKWMAVTGTISDIRDESSISRGNPKVMVILKWASLQETPIIAVFSATK
jgi:hypothetical protein